jgi:hypothetical protein
VDYDDDDDMKKDNNSIVKFFSMEFHNYQCKKTKCLSK